MGSTLTKVSRSKFPGMATNHPIDFGLIDSLCGTKLMCYTMPGLCFGQMKSSTFPLTFC